MTPTPGTRHLRLSDHLAVLLIALLLLLGDSRPLPLGLLIIAALLLICFVQFAERITHNDRH